MQDLRFGVIGWGYWGPRIARNLDTLPQAKVAMVADADAGRLAMLAVNRPGIQTTIQVEDLFSPDIDAVFIATPVPTHFQLAREALLHHKHVLVENTLPPLVTEPDYT